MDKNEIEALRQSATEDYLNKKKKLDDDLKEKLDAINVVAGLLDIGNLKPIRTKFPSNILIKKNLPSSDPKPGVNISEEVRKAIDVLEGDFSIRDIREVVKGVDPNITISRNASHGVLTDYVDKGKLEVVELGKGRMPTTYRKKETKQEDSNEDNNKTN